MLAALCRLVREFASARAGNVAITFAFASLPLVAAIGAAIDYSRANSAKASLQAAVDSAALMLAKNAPNMTDGDLDTKAYGFVNAMFNRPGTTGLSVNATYTTNGGSAILVEATANVPTTFLGVLNKELVAIGASSKTKWGSSRLRVALALDNTGSMADDGKMSALKDATKKLLAQLQSAAQTNGDVYVSIIPFSKDVNVGPGYSGENWIDWDDWEDANGSWKTVTTCTKTSRRGKSRCSTNQEWVPAAYSTWNGCITDRDQDYDQRVTAPVPADADLPANRASTLFPAEQYDYCPVPMKALNYNWSAMNTLVNSMIPVGSTNQPIGLVWAWQSLTGGGPFIVPPKDSNYTYKEIIILMSDGLNTENRWTKKFDSDYDKQKKVDDRMWKKGQGSGTCANIKAAGITIYTVHVNTNGDPKSEMLEACASDSEKFWMITTASDLSSVFSKIGSNLTQLRVAE